MFTDGSDCAARNRGAHSATHGRVFQAYQNHANFVVAVDDVNVRRRVVEEVDPQNEFAYHQARHKVIIS